MRLKSSEMLRQYMGFKGFNIRTLANKANVSRATIGHLHSGARGGSCSPETARKVEKALDCPPGLLFEAIASKSLTRGCSMSPKAYSVRTMSAAYGISDTTVRDAINKQELPAYRVGRAIRIHVEDAEKWFRLLTIVGSAEDQEAS